MNRFFSVLFWSIIAAAFIGPGTVTTCASAGASYGYVLLWALTFSTIATLVLQEASARVAIVSGLSLGQAIRQQYFGTKRGVLVLALVVGAIIFGCAAYETGNILGAVNGAALALGWSPKILTLVIGALAGFILFIGAPRTVAYLLSITVALMGVAFLITALMLKPPLWPLLRGSWLPSLPFGSGLLVLGLVGTTVVPYNLFLGSGIAAGQSLSQMRFGLAVSVILGGVISMGIVVVGAAIHGVFNFDTLSLALSQQLGDWARLFFAIGLFAAGFSSAITAPLAAAITASNLFEKEGETLWGRRDWRYRAVWLGILLTGVGFGLSGVRPIPAIILAQALNGIVLPFAAIFLMLVVNDRAVTGETNLNGRFSNLIMAAVVAAAILLGATNVLRAAAAVLEIAPNESWILLLSGFVAAGLLVPISRAVRMRRGKIVT
jgi:Mn2+/Fe2+ NRAMP family transporter